MIHFNPIQREYVAPIDLNTLNSSFTALEQGHKEAVKVASDLKIAYAKYDLNEAEDAWKANEINSIQQTIDANTSFGNAAGALDDIYKKAGDINANPALMGRLKAQANYKKYQDQIDARTDIKDVEEKEWLKSLNKYHYEDKVDANGKIIGGTEWKPVRQAMGDLDIPQLMREAVSMIKPDKGKAQQVRWLDVNGEVTNNPNLDATGEVYDETTMTWERLDSSKIKEAAKMILRGTSGANASLKQKYDFETYKYEKDVANNNGEPIVKEGITDKNGHILSFDNYVDGLVDGFADMMAYNYTDTDYKYGGAKAKWLSNTLAQSSSSTGGSGSNTNGDGTGSGTPIGVSNAGEIETEQDGYSNIVNDKNLALGNIFDYIRKYDPNVAKQAKGSQSAFVKRFSGGNDYGVAVKKFVEYVNKNGVRIKDGGAELRKRFAAFNTYQQIYKNAFANLTPQQQKDIMGGIESNQDNYSATNNPEIVRELNELYRNNDGIAITVSEDFYNKLNKKLGGQGLKGYGIILEREDDGDYIIKVPSNARNKLPRIMSAYESVNSDEGISWRALGNFLTGDGYNEGYIRTYKNTNNDVNYRRFNDTNSKEYSRYGTIATLNVGELATRLSKHYDNSQKKSEKALKKANISNKGFTDIQTTGQPTFGAYDAYLKLKNGIIDTKEYNATVKAETDIIKDKIVNAENYSTRVYVRDEDGRFIEDNSTDSLADIKNAILTDKNNVSISYALNEGGKDSHTGKGIPQSGYIISVMGKDDNGKPTEVRKYYLSEFDTQTAGTQPQHMGVNRSKHIFKQTRATNGYYNYGNSSPSTGQVALGREKDGRMYGVFGNKKYIFKNDKDAQDFSDANVLMEDLKNEYLINPAFYASNKVFNNKVQNICNVISNTTGSPINIVEQQVSDYFNN